MGVDWQTQVCCCACRQRAALVELVVAFVCLALVHVACVVARGSGHACGRFQAAKPCPAAHYPTAPAAPPLLVGSWWTGEGPAPITGIQQPACLAAWLDSDTHTAPPCPWCLPRPHSRAAVQGAHVVNQRPASGDLQGRHHGWHSPCGCGCSISSANLGHTLGQHMAGGFNWRGPVHVCMLCACTLKIHSCGCARCPARRVCCAGSSSR
jgi:hypothetical protein